jgi:hypothetical protein
MSSRSYDTQQAMAGVVNPVVTIPYHALRYLFALFGAAIVENPRG